MVHLQMTNKRSCVFLKPRHLIMMWEKNNIFGIKPYLFSLNEFGRIFSLQLLLLIFHCLGSKSYCLVFRESVLWPEPVFQIFYLTVLLPTWSISSFPNTLCSQRGISFHLFLLIWSSRASFLKAFLVPRFTVSGDLPSSQPVPTFNLFPDFSRNSLWVLWQCGCMFYCLC